MQDPHSAKRRAWLTVAAAQLKNPLISLRGLQFEVSDSLSFDFFFPESRVGVVFLSLRYHYQNPIYINSRVAALQQSGELARAQTALLVVVLDREDPNDHLLPLQMLRFEVGLQVLLAKNGRQFVGLMKSVGRQAQRSAIE